MDELEVATLAGEAPDRLQRQTSWLLNQARVAGNRRVAARLGPRGVRTDYAVLAALEQFGPISQADLGRRLGIDRSDVVALLNRLGDDGLVHREPDPRDRRRNSVAITPLGLERLGALDDAVSLAQDDLLEPLDPQERTVLVGLLQRIVAHHRSQT